MGWLFYRKPENVKAHLEEMLTHTNSDGGTRRVLKSAICKMSVWYAAVEDVKADGARSVWAAVFLISFRGEPGFDFGYKDMSEHVGPCETECPEAILNLLTPLDPKEEYAIRWRAECRENIANRAALKVGARVEFSTSWTIGGKACSVFKIIARHGKSDWVWMSEDGHRTRLGGWRGRIKFVGERPTPVTESVTLADGAADQALVPGVPAVEPTARELATLEASRDARRRHGAMPAGGLFDDVARAQLDLF